MSATNVVDVWGSPHPIILNKHLWYRSDHQDHYRDIMYTTVIDAENYAVKP